MANVNQLITRLAAVDNFSRTMSKFDHDINRAEGGMKKLKVAAGTAGTAVAAAVAALAAGGTALGIAAVKANAEWEQLTITMESLTGSAEVAARKLDFVRALAIPATATTQELAAAALQLEAMGVNAERALPLAARLQAAFQFDPQALEKASSIIGRLAQGDFPDIELMSGLGLNKAQFRQQGIKFDSQGKMLSSAREAMDALERIVLTKYGDILEKVSRTTNSKLATLRDRWEQVMRDMGAVILTTVGPAIERLTTWLEKLTKSGDFEKWMKSVMFQVRNLGVMISVVGTSLFIIVALIQLAMKNIVGAVLSTVAAIATFFAGRNIQRVIDDIMKQSPGGTARPGATVPQGQGGWGNISDNMDATAKNTRQIAENTKPLLDMRRLALGGGPLGQLGITPIEFAGVRRAGQQIIVNVRTGANQTMEQWVADIVQETVSAMQRQRQL